MVSGEADTGREDPSADPFVGTVVNGRFHIERRIARGGMSSVYFATQVPLSRPVAIKVVRCVDPGSEENFRRRFLQEASILAQLQHPNIVTLLEYGPLTDAPNEHYFMAMEYLRGETLAKRFKREGRLSIEESIRLARQIGRGLREAHRRGFIHRDLKPSNIMLVPEDDKNDIVKLVDFGIGKIVNTRQEISAQTEGDEMTRVGLLLGSPRYMSPEQIRSEPVELRTDLYGLGVILFQALTGRLPFEGRTEVEVLLAHCSMIPPGLSDVCPGEFYPEPLSRLVRSLLEKQAKNRPTVEEFLAYLASIEEEVFGTVSLAGPTLQGMSAVPISLRASTGSRPLVGPDAARLPESAPAGASFEDLDATPVLAPSRLASTLPSPLLPPPRRKAPLSVIVMAAAVVLVSALIWVVAIPSRSPGEAGSRSGKAPGIPTLAVTTRPEPQDPRVEPAEPATFTLNIESIPSDATVTEAGRLVGVTPLAIVIERNSVAGGPRRFVVRHEGYAPFTLEQGDSKAPIRASPTLVAVVNPGRDRPRRSASRRSSHTPLASDPDPGSPRTRPARIARGVSAGSPSPYSATASGLEPDSPGAPRRGGGITLDIRTRR